MVNTTEKSGINIIIPFHGCYNAVRECIGSIFLHTRHIPFKITVIDDASPNKYFFSTITQIDKQIDGIRFDEPKGFGACINEGIKAAKEPWLVFLNSDCLIKESQWLIEIFKTLENGMKEKIGLVSATMNNGAGFKNVERNQLKRNNKSTIIADSTVPLICAITPRKLFDKIGLLKEYKPAGYEDEFLHWQMKKNGYKQAICEKSWVFHYGGLTIQNMCLQNPDIENIIYKENQNRCFQDIKQLGFQNTN